MTVRGLSGSGAGSASVSSGAGSASVSSGPPASPLPVRFPKPTKASTNPWTIAPAPRPMPPSSSASPVIIPLSGLYTPFSIAFWSNPCAVSCAPSIPPVTAARCILDPQPFSSCGPIFETTSLSAGANLLLIRANGITSNRPGAIPHRAATLRSSCVAPPARARSLASPTPIEAAIEGTRTGAKGPVNAAGKRLRKDPTPCANFAESSSGLASSGFTASAILRITSRAATSFSSSSGVMAPRAAVSRPCTKPAGTPLRTLPTRVVSSSSGSGMNLFARSSSSSERRPAIRSLPF